eukprot:TRINITY_DN11453_c1_g4_i1.p1 TRINITY_DN11453_c1_g4~~TRINITY_DN11453_c1_g4_i1.p1  ORF type:complete len:413 (+),score=18.46 TRINITY_DN11453_c1_g4_i1:88-1326(+)
MSERTWLLSGQPQSAEAVPAYVQPPKAVDAPTFRGETPEVDVEETSNTEPPKPSQPPSDFFDQVPGYGTVGMEPTIQQPSIDKAPSQPPRRHGSIPPPPRLTEAEARRALEDEVSMHCCWSGKPAREMIFSKFLASSAFHYVLETFTEKRSVEWKIEPYYGQPIDDRQSGPTPLAWQIPVKPDGLFKTSTRSIEVPHTASIKQCYYCASFGQVRCYKCKGRGKLRCSQCRGQGYRVVKDKHGNKHRETCTRCFGSGRKRCPVCFGHGQTSCPVCHSRGQLKAYLQLNVSWSNHASDHVVEGSSGPGASIRAGEGTLLYTEEAELVAPVNDFPEDQVNTGSHGLIARHNKAWPTERILRQRHRIRSVPVHEVSYVYHDVQHTFWVYGLDHQVCSEMARTCLQPKLIHVIGVLP